MPPHRLGDQAQFVARPLPLAPAGFGSDESFRRHFRLAMGVSPLAYRKQFGAGAGSVASRLRHSAPLAPVARIRG